MLTAKDKKKNTVQFNLYIELLTNLQYYIHMYIRTYNTYRLHIHTHNHTYIKSTYAHTCIHTHI